MRVGARRKCEAVVGGLFSRGELSTNSPAPQIGLVVVGLGGLEVMVVPGRVRLRLRVRISGRDHEKRGTGRKAIYLFRQVAVRGPWSYSRSKPCHAVRELHVGDRRSEQLTDAADVRRDIIHSALGNLSQSSQCDTPKCCRQDKSRCDLHSFEFHPFRRARSALRSRVPRFTTAAEISY